MDIEVHLISKTAPNLKETMIFILRSILIFKLFIYSLTVNQLNSNFNESLISNFNNLNQNRKWFQSYAPVRTVWKMRERLPVAMVS